MHGRHSLSDGRIHEDAAKTLVRVRGVQMAPQWQHAVRHLRALRAREEVVERMVALILLALAVAFSGGLVIGILVAEGSQRRLLRSLYRARFGEEAP